MPGKSTPTRPTQPLDAFPDKDWRAWRTHVLDLDIEVVYAAAIAERLDAVLARYRDEKQGLRQVAEMTGASRTGLWNVSQCRTYPMAGMVARLEHSLQVSLWPGDAVAAARAAALLVKLNRAQTDVDRLTAALRSQGASERSDT